MAAPRPTFQSARIPPDVPPDPKISDSLAQYLRTFANWCRIGFSEQLRNDTALPGILIQATDAATGKPTSFSYLVGVKVTVTGGVPSAPTITFTPILLGSGLP
jgi:hypothetical protein